MKLEGLFSLYPPLRIDSDFHVKAFEKFIDHFETERELHVRGSDFHDGELLFVRVEPCRASRHRRFFRNAPFCKPENWLLRFFGSFNFPGKERYFLTDHAGKKVRTTEKELRSLWASWLPDHLDLTVQTYIVSLMGTSNNAGFDA